MVMSGKGGVGKSTVAAFIAREFARRKEEILKWRMEREEEIEEQEEEEEEDDKMVVLLDIDLTGPSIPRILGVATQRMHTMQRNGWTPIMVNDTLACISIGFLLESYKDAVVWKGDKKNGIIKQFLRDTDWSDTDTIIIDTPPGTSDEHLTTVQLMKQAGITGAVLVTTPHQLALDDVRKEINFCQKTSIKILGVIENMSGFECPNCHAVADIFPAPAEENNARAMCQEFGVPYLGKLPIDPMVGQAGDAGTQIHENSQVAIAWKKIMIELDRQLGQVAT